MSCGVVLSLVDMTFTRKNILRAVEKVEDTDKLGLYLGVPKSKRDEIKKEFSSEVQQRKAFISYFFEHDPVASWRSVICALDRMGQTEAADAIRHLAEALLGRAGTVAQEGLMYVKGCVCITIHI